MSKVQVQSFNKIANPDKFITNDKIKFVLLNFTKRCNIIPSPPKDNLQTDFICVIKLLG